MAANPIKLIVAVTTKEAERIRDAFGLNAGVWVSGDFASVLRHHVRYDRVVVQLPDRLSDEVKDVVQHLRILLLPEGELIFI